MIPPIYHWSTDALICACTKKFQFDKKRKERRSVETAIWDTSPKDDDAAAQRARESLDERNAENVADRLRRARARSDQQMANRVNSQAETNVSEDDCVRGKGDQAIAVASTGMAATFLSGGRTAHSIFKIPLTLNATSTCNLKPNTSEANILLDAKVIVWDEAPMTHVHAFLAVDRLLKDLTKCDEPFGGKILLLGGDFRQVLPVILRGSRSLTVSSCIKKHRLWSDFFVMKLTENMRAFASEKEFASWLLHVGEGESGEKIQLPPFCYPEIQDPVQQLFSDIDFKTVTPEELKGRAILTVTNDLSMQINNRVLECMPGNEVIYESIDNIVSNDPQDHLAYTEEFLNSLTPTGMPPHKLRLKPGTIIMLLRNLAPSKGLCNGTRLIVIQLQKNVIVAKKN
ncbi:hypothetical protein AVEN_104931-1 [Araneus ventricosus]|uniref:ATP-dependent DNA helicase n=1 Tax=Araneus ventricosus TaxID=182803 RepID=A0A4Y2QXJ2_ARAVE|nr:hypothetical protein AVEN_104931-1 [Araneus ventricosus]